MGIGLLQLAALIVVLVSAIPLLRLVGRHEREAKVARFAGRADMDFEDFYRSFYADSGLPSDMVRRALNEVSELTGIPAEKLRPSDRFAGELAPVPGSEFGDGLAVLSRRMRQRLKRAHLPGDLSVINTLDDFIRLIAGPERGRRQNG